MENAINFVRGEAEKHFSNSINCCLFHALLYHTSQKYCSGDGWRVFEEEAFKPLLAADKTFSCSVGAQNRIQSGVS